MKAVAAVLIYTSMAMELRHLKNMNYNILHIHDLRLGYSLN